MAAPDAMVCGPLPSDGSDLGIFKPDAMGECRQQRRHDGFRQERTLPLEGHQHFTRDLVKEGRTSLNYLPTPEVVADLLMKALPVTQHEQLAKDIGFG